MVNIPERRHTGRLTVPPQFNAPWPAEQDERLVDLSPEGACIEHLGSVPHWDVYFLVLPRALGGIRLQGQVVWSRAMGQRLNAQGVQQVSYLSGLRFASLTAEQRAGLTHALEILRAAEEAQPAPRPAGEAPGATGEREKGPA